MKGQNTVLCLVILSLTTSCTGLRSYEYAYTMPYGPRGMTPLKDGNPDSCKKEFPSGIVFRSGAVLDVPTNAATLGHLILIHGKDVRSAPIFHWTSEQGAQWYVIELTGEPTQLKAHSPNELVKKIEEQFGR